MCVFLIGAGVWSSYADASRKEGSVQLRFETSYVSTYPFDDIDDTPYRGGIVGTSPRGSSIVKLTAVPAPRRARFTPPIFAHFQRAAHSLLSSQDLFRLSKVYRI